MGNEPCKPAQTDLVEEYTSHRLLDVRESYDYWQESLQAPPQITLPQFDELFGQLVNDTTAHFNLFAGITTTDEEHNNEGSQSEDEDPARKLRASLGQLNPQNKREHMRSKLRGGFKKAIATVVDNIDLMHSIDLQAEQAAEEAKIAEAAAVAAAAQEASKVDEEEEDTDDEEEDDDTEDEEEDEAEVIIAAHKAEKRETQSFTFGSFGSLAGSVAGSERSDASSRLAQASAVVAASGRDVMGSSSSRVAGGMRRSSRSFAGLAEKTIQKHIVSVDAFEVFAVAALLCVTDIKESLRFVFDMYASRAGKQTGKAHLIMMESVCSACKSALGKPMPDEETLDRKVQTALESVNSDNTNGGSSRTSSTTTMSLTFGAFWELCEDDSEMAVYLDNVFDLRREARHIAGQGVAHLSENITTALSALMQLDDDDDAVVAGDVSAEELRPSGILAKQRERIFQGPLTDYSYLRQAWRNFEGSVPAVSPMGLATCCLLQKAQCALPLIREHHIYHHHHGHHRRDATPSTTLSYYCGLVSFGSILTAVVNWILERQGKEEQEPPDSEKPIKKQLGGPETTCASTTVAKARQSLLEGDEITRVALRTASQGPKATPKKGQKGGSFGNNPAYDEALATLADLLPDALEQRCLLCLTADHRREKGESIDAALTAKPPPSRNSSILAASTTPAPRRGSSVVAPPPRRGSSVVGLPGPHQGGSMLSASGAAALISRNSSIYSTSRSSHRGSSHRGSSMMSNGPMSPAQSLLEHIKCHFVLTDAPPFALLNHFAQGHLYAALLNSTSMAAEDVHCVLTPLDALRVLHEAPEICKGTTWHRSLLKLPKIQRQPLCVRPTDSVWAALELIATQKVGAVAVVDEDGCLFGSFSAELLFLTLRARMGLIPDILDQQATHEPSAGKRGTVKAQLGVAKEKKAPNLARSAKKMMSLVRLKPGSENEPLPELVSEDGSSARSSFETLESASSSHVGRAAQVPTPPLPTPKVEPPPSETRLVQSLGPLLLEPLGPLLTALHEAIPSTRPITVRLNQSLSAAIVTAGMREGTSRSDRIYVVTSRAPGATTTRGRNDSITSSGSRGETRGRNDSITSSGSRGESSSKVVSKPPPVRPTASQRSAGTPKSASSSSSCSSAKAEKLPPPPDLRQDLVSVILVADIARHVIEQHELCEKEQNAAMAMSAAPAPPPQTGGALREKTHDKASKGNRCANQSLW